MTAEAIMGVVRGDDITLSDGCPHTPGIAIDTRLSIIKSLPVSYMRREVKGHAYILYQSWAVHGN